MRTGPLELQMTTMMWVWTWLLAAAQVGICTLHNHLAPGRYATDYMLGCINVGQLMKQGMPISAESLLRSPIWPPLHIYCWLTCCGH